MKRDLLYEIGVEEIPASYLPPARQQFREEFEKFLAESHLTCESAETEATPRRLVLIVRGIPGRQEDRTLEVLGPPWKAAFGPDGKPTKAAEGFAKGRGLTVADLRQVDTERGPYVGASVQVVGRATIDLLAEALPDITQRLAFPKSMKWGPSRMRFPRPIRWLLALFGNEVIPFTIEDVTTGKLTHGHRILSRGPFEVSDPSGYAAALDKGRIVLRQADRAKQIETLLLQAAQRVGGELVPDPELVEEVSYLVETPFAFDSTFDPEFLELPAPVIVTAMRDHQRYFALRGTDGELMPRFVCVANSAPESVDQVRNGNQRVLRARLDDARFYWNEDLKSSLEEKLPRLDHVVWLEGFGTLRDKTDRLVRLVEELAGKCAERSLSVASRAALLSKGDLVTEMIKDGKQFASLQGVMGREYALRHHEPEEVAQAILEQYLPRFAGDALPITEAGALLAVADRLDTLVGVWASGQKPTGSKDPFGLRRGVLGILRILLERQWDLSVTQLLESAAGHFGVAVSDRALLVSEIGAFVADRLEGLFVEEGHDAEVVFAVVAAAADRPVDVRARVLALAEVRSSKRDEFTALAAGFKRAKNILKKECASGEPDVAFLQEEAERSLHEAYILMRESVEKASRDKRYGDALLALAKLRAPIDHFFDSVMVLADDPAIRENRLRLLGRIVDRVQLLADVTRLASPDA